jgi:hypothetical protein
MTSLQHRLEEAMDEQYGDQPHLDLEGFFPSLPGELSCDCGDRPYVTALVGEVLTCPTCGARYAVATRLTLLPL